MNRYKTTIVGTFLVLLMIAGCSGAGKSPVTPGDMPTDYQMDNVPIIGLSESELSSNAIGLMGAYDLTIDLETVSAELVSKRTASIGESWLLSGMSYFALDPCADCLKISEIGLFTNEIVRLAFDIRHPFPVGNPQLPPSARNRNDLNLFDPILIVRPLNKPATEFGLMKASIYDGIAYMPHGYTRELSNLMNDDTACPFFLVVDDSFTGSRTYNIFPQGASRSFVAMIKPDGVLNFELYLTMGYGASAELLTRLRPDYFNPEFNRKPAWKVRVTPPQGNSQPQLGNTWREDDDSTPYKVRVEVWDWQQGVNSIANPPVNQGDIAFPSNVASVSVEIPGMNDELPTVTQAVRGSGSDPRNPLVFEVPVVNENLLSPGEYLGIVKVTDEREPPQAGTLIQSDSLVHNPGDFNLEWFRIPEYATYQTFIATVVAEPCEASGSIVEPTEEDEYIAFSGEIVDFVIDGAPSGNNVLVAWWADWGTGEFTESSPIGEFSHEFIDENCPEYADAVYNVRFGMELECTQGDIIVLDSIKIIMECPVCEANGSIVSPTGSLHQIMNGQTMEFELEATPYGGDILAFWADWGTGDFTDSSPTNFIENQFISDICPDFSQAPPPVENLRLKVNRLWGGAVNQNMPFNLEWDDPGAVIPDDEFTVRFAVELDCHPGNLIPIGSTRVRINSCYQYEVYWDNDPTDGFTNDLQPLGTVTNRNWNSPADHLNVAGTHYVPGNTYVVYTKNINEVLSDEPSNPAHVIFTGVETVPTGQNAYDFEGWLSHNHSGNVSVQTYRPFTYEGVFMASGTRSIRFGNAVGRTWVGNWQGISRETPVIPGAEKRIVEFSMLRDGSG